jgi:hypothetical protein
MSVSLQTGTAEAKFGCNVLFYIALGRSQQHSMTEAPQKTNLKLQVGIHLNYNFVLGCGKTYFQK